MYKRNYCRFEETVSILEDCFTDMHNEKKLSKSEQAKRYELIDLCMVIAHDFGETQE